MNSPVMFELNLSDGIGLIVRIPTAPLLAFALVCIMVLIVFRFFMNSGWRLKAVKLKIDLGGIGEVELHPSHEDVQIAHQIWTELVTRKAAIPVDPDNDVIVEIYDSWYALFGRVRQLISSVPAEIVRHDSTQKLINIAIGTLNNGLRPHLTKWQARFRHWSAVHSEEYKGLAPQERQKHFPEYKELISEMRAVNKQLIQYADQLKKIVM